jgi:Flp pilus assembly protein TadG
MHLDSYLRQERARLSRASHRNRSWRSQRGTLIIELTASAFLFTFFAIMAVHVGVMIFGAFLNDRACRDAARAAAQGKTIAQATQLAQAVLIAHKQTNSFLTSPSLQTPIVYQDFGGNPPNPQTSPYVQVTTSTTANLPFAPINFLSGVFTQDKQLTFRQTYTFPIVRVN